MARLTPVYGHSVLVQIETATPGTYAHSALINGSRAFSFTTETDTDEIIDLADQSAPAITTRRVRATDFKIDGEGKLNAADLKEWIDRWDAGAPINVKAVCDDTTVTVPMIITSMSVSGDRTEMVGFSVTLEQAGAPTITATP